MRRRTILMAGLAALVLGLAGCAEAAPDGSPAAPLGEVRIELVAAGIAFDRAEVSVEPERAFRIVLDNRDVNIPHGVTVMGGPGFSTEVIVGEIVNGPAQVDLELPTGLVAGAYRLICPVHPITMVTDLTVAP